MGLVYLYDIRSSKPLLVKDHQYDEPINTILFQGNTCISSDSKICKLWDKNDGKSIANIEMGDIIHTATLVPNSGTFILFFTHHHHYHLSSYYSYYLRTDVYHPYLLRLE